MTAPIVTTSSIPLTGNAVVTQGCEKGVLPSAADAITFFSRPGFFLLDIRAQSPPSTPPEAASDDGTTGTALPTGGNFLPLLFLSELRQQPEPAVLPPAVLAPRVGTGTPPSAGSSGDVAQITPAPAHDIVPAGFEAILDPAMQAATKMLELLRPRVVDSPDAPSAAALAPTPVALAGVTADAVALPANLVAQAVQLAPDMLATLIKRMTHDAPATDASKLSQDAAASVPLVQAPDGNPAQAVPSMVVPSIKELKQFIDGLPKHVAVDQVAGAQTDAPAASRTTNDVPPAPLFVDGPALRGHAAAQPTDATAQNLRVDVPMRSAEWAQALGERITWLVDQNLSTAQIRLNPPQLGPIEVHIALAGDSTQVSVSAHSVITRDALEAAAPRLREALSAHGLGNVSVDISQHSFTNRSMPQARSEAWEPWQALTSDTVTVSAPGAYVFQGAGRLDAYA
jgi:flagellar hook-length control protein FliK